MAAIVTRAGKGSPLTNAEVDANFTNLNDELGTMLPTSGGTMTGAITFAAGQTWPTFNQSTTGNAATATALQTSRTINGTSFNGTANITTASWGTSRTLSYTGDVTGSASVNGSVNVATAMTLANSGVTAGTYTKVTVDAKGRVTTGATLASADLPTYTGTLTSLQVTTALGYTPYNSTNPNGYTTNTGTVTSVALSLPAIFSVSGSPVTTSGTLTAALASQTANLVFAAPNGVAGAPTFRSLVAADIPTLNQNTTGSAATLTTARTIGMTGDVTWTSAAFNGSANVTGTATLANSGVTAGTYTSLTVDAKGRVTAGTNPTTLSGYGITDAVNTSLLGAANGVATLNASGLVPSSQLPSYVDDVLEYADLAGFPTTGETGKIYIALDTNKTYRWSGTTYVEISASPGTTDAVPEGSTNLYFTNARARAAISVTQNLTYNSSTGVITGPNLSSYLTGNQTITLSGDASGSGATAISVSIGAATVTGKALTGYTAGTNTALAATDTILAAFGKVQGQINARLTGNQTITVSGDATGSGATSIALTLANSGVTAGTYTKVTVDAKGRVTTGASLASGDLPTYTGTLTSSQVTTALGYTPYNSTNPNGYTSNTGTVTSVALSLPTIFSVSGSPVTTSGTLTASLASQTANTFLAAPNGSAGAPSFRSLAADDIPDLTMAKLPGAAYKQSVRCATTANITLSGTQTIDGIAVVAGDRVLVKNQSTASQNGIYVASASTWTRALDADSAAEIGAAIVNVDSGTANGGELWTTTFKTTDTLGTTAMNWYEVLYNTGTWGISISGSAATLTTGRTIGMTGDVTWTSAAFNGSANVTGTATLANSGVTAGSYGSSSAIPVLTVDAKGRVTSVSTAAVAGGQYLGTAATKAIAYNAQSIAENITIGATQNGLSAGPITISSGYTVTISSGGVWVIV